MKLPYRPRSLPIARRRFKYIVIHDVSCQFEGITEFYTDNVTFQTGKLRSNDFILNGNIDLNYHYVVEKVQDDFQTIVGRPLYALCEYDDIDPKFEYSIHIAMMGSYDYIKPEERFYKQMAYRCIVPLMKIYRIAPPQVFMHHEISEQGGCPGALFNGGMLQSYLSAMKVSN